jgi:hypothetical protein
VEVESVGDSSKIASGAIRDTKNPRDILLAQQAAKLLMIKMMASGINSKKQGTQFSPRQQLLICLHDPRMMSAQHIVTDEQLFKELFTRP